MRLREINPASCPFPVGIIVEFASDADPNELYSGTTWPRMRGGFLYAADDDHVLGETGGDAAHTLTLDEMPSHDHAMGAHTHAFTQPTVPAHNHGLNSHTHTYAKPNTPTGGTAISVAQLAAHSHSSGANANGFAAHLTTDKIGKDIILKSDAGSGEWMRYRQPENIGSGSAHTHTIGTTSTNSGGPSTANTADKAAFTCTGGAVGAMNNSPATGSRGGQPFSLLPPYEVVNRWKRTA